MALRSDGHPIHAGTNFRHSNRQNATCCSLSFRAYHHYSQMAGLYTRLSVLLEHFPRPEQIFYFRERPKLRTYFPTSLGALTKKLGLPLSGNLNKHWMIVVHVVYSCLMSCGRRRCIVTPWISVDAF